jgi:hypothetical protein
LEQLDDAFLSVQRKLEHERSQEILFCGEIDLATNMFLQLRPAPIEHVATRGLLEQSYIEVCCAYFHFQKMSSSEFARKQFENLPEVL